MPSFTRESGGTLHVAVMGVNRIGKVYSSYKISLDVVEIRKRGPFHPKLLSTRRFASSTKVTDIADPGAILLPDRKFEMTLRVKVAALNPVW